MFDEFEKRFKLHSDRFLTTRVDARLILTEREQDLECTQRMHNHNRDRRDDRRQYIGNGTDIDIGHNGRWGLKMATTITH